MAVLWLELGRTDEPGLAEALAGSGVEVRRWRAGQPLPEELRGVAGVVLSGGGAADPGVAALVEAAVAAELPLLVVGAAAGLVGRREPVDGAERWARTAWALPGTDAGAGPGARQERRAAHAGFAAVVAAEAHTAENRAFFTPRAAAWEKKFPDDLPRYRAGVAALGLRPGQVALDAGCGTGRALPLLREAVGPGGAVLGTDVTPAMLREAVRMGRGDVAALALADCLRLPLPGGAVHGVFAAGLLPHVPDPLVALRELARVAAPGARLAVFHAVGRAVLAARHGRVLGGPDDPLAEANLAPLLAESGWRLHRYEDPDSHFLALAERV
ncbi:hypothetical protein GCM10027168_06870 [Streptomyces capparidis]